MYKAAVMGDRDSIYGFAALGLDIFPETDPAQAAKRLRTLGPPPGDHPDPRAFRQHGQGNRQRPEIRGAGGRIGHHIPGKLTETGDRNEHRRDPKGSRSARYRGGDARRQYV